MHIGDRIRTLRKKYKMSQGELAEKIGTTKQNIYKYEHGIITNIPSDKIEQLAKVLDTTPGYLMGWENPHVTQIKILEGLEAVRRNPSIYLEKNTDKLIDFLSEDKIELLLSEISTEDFYFKPTHEEIEHIKKYRSLDTYGKRAVDTVMDNELYRIESQRYVPEVLAASRPNE